MTAPAPVAKPGIYDGYDEETYHADPALSYSSAKVIITPGGPAKYRWMRDNPEEHKATFDEGSAAHRLVTGVGPDLVDIGTARLVGDHKAEAEALRADGKLPLKTPAYRKVQAMAEALDSLHTVRDLLTAPGQSEVSVWNVDETTRRLIRGRIDRMNDTYLIDYKTTTNADPEEFVRRAALTYRYYLQRVWYEHLDLFGRQLLFIVQPKEPPYSPFVVRLPESYTIRGRAEMRTAIDLWDRCLRTDTWPGFPDRILTPPAPSWFDPYDTPGDPND